MPEDTELNKILNHMAKYSLFRDFTYGWPYNDFTGYANNVSADYRRLARKYRVVGTSVSIFSSGTFAT